PGIANKFDFSTLPANATAGIALSNLNFVMRDEYNNPTNTFLQGTSLTTCTPAMISITPAIGLTSPGGRFLTTAQAPSPPTAQSGNSIGQFKTNFTLYKSGVNNITFSGCGVSSVHTISVSPSNAFAGFFSTASSDAGISANATEFDCPHSSTAATNSSVTCPAINAFFIDAWGNSLNGGNPVACTWNYTNAAPGTGLSAAVTPTNSGAGGTANLSASDFIDGSLSCTKDSQTLTTKIYGGISKIALSTGLTSNSTLVASAGNVSITSIQLYQRRNGNDVAKPAAASTTFNVNIDTGSSNNGFADVVASTESGYSSSTSTISRSFNTTGVSESSVNLNYKKAAVGTTNTLTMRIQGKTWSFTGLTVEPNIADSIVVTKVNSTAVANSTIPAATAGSAFSLEAEIRDAVGNPTWKSTSTANCSGTALTISSASSTSPGNTSAIGTATTFDPAAVTNKSAMTSSTSGTYSIGNIILYAAGSKSLSLSACGLSPSFSVTVNPASAANMAINTTAVGNTTRISEYECDNTGTNDVVKCAALYASFWDQYGNPRSTDTCDSWSYVTNNSAPVPPYSTAAVASQTVAQLTHATDKYFDGTLTCNKSGITSNNAVLLWGGVKQVTLTTNPATIPSSITAANANLKITKVKIETPKAGTLTTPTKNLSKSVVFKSNSSTARLNGQATDLSGTSGLSQNCTFVSATAAIECTPSPTYDFNFTKAESAVYLDVSVHGVAATRLGTFNVTPANASQIVLTQVAGSAATSLGTRTAGTPFTFVSQVQDSFSNPTTLSNTGSDCSSSALTLSGGGGTSPGGTSTSIGTATPFSAAAATGTGANSMNTTNATYSVGNVIFYNAGSQSLSLQVCGAPATSFAVTVNPGPVANVALNTEGSASNIQLTEFECENSGTGLGMTCPALNAWFWDAYGNARSTDKCDSWSYATTGGAPVPPFNTATTTKV
ncbi:hypothetical protein EBR21_10130, partial [bacterium]|nr:hypothetical protein [bacterium]